jgi:hypothetical protein
LGAFRLKKALARNLNQSNRRGVNADPLKRMRERVAQCRRMAEHMTDPQTIAILRQMAEEGEADLKRLLAQREKQGE